MQKIVNINKILNLGCVLNPLNVCWGVCGSTVADTFLNPAVEL